MKKIILLLSVILVSVISYSQEEPTPIRDLRSFTDARTMGQLNNDIRRGNRHADSLYSHNTRIIALIARLDILETVSSGYMSFGDSSIVVTLVEDTWASLRNSSDSTYIVHDTTNVTMVGDTITMKQAGDYRLDFSAQFSATHADTIQFTLYKNFAATGSPVTITTMDSTIQNVAFSQKLDSLIIGDDLGFYVRNQASNDSIILVGSHVLIELIEPH